jgi:hypothetical protein
MTRALRSRNLVDALALLFKKRKNSVFEEGFGGAIAADWVVNDEERHYPVKTVDQVDCFNLGRLFEVRSPTAAITPIRYDNGLLVRAMTLLTKAPIFKPFNLALIQLGGVGVNKSENLKHAREMILKAAKGSGGSKPDVIVLPVRRIAVTSP